MEKHTLQYQGAQLTYPCKIGQAFSNFGKQSNPTLSLPENQGWTIVHDLKFLWMCVHCVLKALREHNTTIPGCTHNSTTTTLPNVNSSR